jgi:hypothetical protein
MILGLTVAVAAVMSVVVARDRERMYDARKIRTYAQIQEFAERNETAVLFSQNNTVSTYTVRVGYPFLGNIAREFRWCEEYSEFFQSEVVFNNW